MGKFIVLMLVVSMIHLACYVEAGKRTHYLIRDSSKKRKCNFDLYKDFINLTPEHSDACTLNYEKTTYAVGKDGGWSTDHYTAYYPWCPLEGGSWDYCDTYNWRYLVDNNFVGSKLKLYYSQDDYYKTNYIVANYKCTKTLNYKLQVASFQTMFNSTGNHIIKNENYYTSLKNLREILDTLKGFESGRQQYWVKNDQKFEYKDGVQKRINLNHCLSYDYNKNTINFTSCYSKLTFVCEMDTKNL